MNAAVLVLACALVCAVLERRRYRERMRRRHGLQPTKAKWV